MARIWPTMGMKPFWTIFFSSTRDNWVVLFASRGNNGNTTSHPDKERDSRGCGKKNSSGTG
jgi:hypothetical protein